MYVIICMSKLKSCRFHYLSFCLKDGLMMWSSSAVLESHDWQPRSAQIEMTSYVLLALIRRGSFVEGIDLMKWLSEQRNHLGGYGTTQVTLCLFSFMQQIDCRFQSINGWVFSPLWYYSTRNSLLIKMQVFFFSLASHSHLRTQSLPSKLWPTMLPSLVPMPLTSGSVYLPQQHHPSHYLASTPLTSKHIRAKRYKSPVKTHPVDKFLDNVNIILLDCCYCSWFLRFMLTKM